MNLTPLGDRAVLIQLGDAIDDVTHRRVRAVCARLTARPVPGMIELVPAYASVAVHYDPTGVPNGRADRESPYARFCTTLMAALQDLEHESLPEPRHVDIAVAYGGSSGPDLEEVARLHDMTPDEVVSRHSGAIYRVYMLGFAPGFAYLGGLPTELATPRRAEPRTNVPAGSVGIGGSQTGVYPLASPGGWQIIGRTSLKLFDPARDPPTLLQTGDIVRFHAVGG